MKNDNVVQIKGYAFAKRIIMVFKYLSEQKKEYILSEQLLRCGTSIGANIEEAIGGQSSKDFYAKLIISYKEARETHYWIRLLKDINYIPEDEAESLLKDVDELLRIIGSIQKTLRSTTNS